MVCESGRHLLKFTLQLQLLLGIAVGQWLERLPHGKKVLSWTDGFCVKLLKTEIQSF